MNHKKAGKRERGATLVEYALLVALIGVVALVGTAHLGKSAGKSFEDVAKRLGDNSATGVSVMDDDDSSSATSPPFPTPAADPEQ